MTNDKTITFKIGGSTHMVAPTSGILMSGDAFSSSGGSYEGLVEAASKAVSGSLDLTFPVAEGGECDGFNELLKVFDISLPTFDISFTTIPGPNRKRWYVVREDGTPICSRRHKGNAERIARGAGATVVRGGEEHWSVVRDCTFDSISLAPSEPPAGFKRPFRYDGVNYIWDANGEMAADFDGVDSALRPRGWGRIGTTFDDPHSVMDAWERWVRAKAADSNDPEEVVRRLNKE